MYLLLLSLRRKTWDQPLNLETQSMVAGKEDRDSCSVSVACGRACLSLGGQDGSLHLPPRPRPYIPKSPHNSATCWGCSVETHECGGQLTVCL